MKPKTTIFDIAIAFLSLSIKNSFGLVLAFQGTRRTDVQPDRQVQNQFGCSSCHRTPRRRRCQR